MPISMVGMKKCLKSLRVMSNVKVFAKHKGRPVARKPGLMDQPVKVVCFY